MRIAFFLPYLAGGGAEKVSIELMKSFSERGDRVDLLLVRIEGELINKIPENVNVINFNKDRIIKSALPLVVYLREYKPDVLFSTLTLTNILSIILGKIFSRNTKVIIRVSNVESKRPFPLLKRWLHQLLLILTYRFADEIVCNSNIVTDDICTLGLIHSSKPIMIYNPTITADLFEQSKLKIGTNYNKKGEILILGVGRLSPQKDFSTLIDSFAIIHKQIPSKLIILGEGELRYALEEKIIALGLGEDILLMGHLDNPYPVYMDADVFVLSSVYEGLPNVLIEALALGLRIVSTDCPGGIREILDQDKFGILVPVGDKQAMATGILSSISQEPHKADPEWLDRFSSETVISQYIDLMS